jgi:mono/diheme cytochrome c family protein
MRRQLKYLQISVTCGLIALFYTNCGFEGSHTAGFKNLDSASGINGSTGVGSGSATEQQAIGILSAKCLSCHGSNGFGGISNILDIPTLIRTGLVVPESPDSSNLIQSVEANRMPPGSPLTASEKSLLREWVLGSPGATPVATPTPIATPIATPTPAVVVSTYASIASTILTPKCVGCHGPNLARAGIRYDSYNASKLTVVVNNINASRLYASCAPGGSMPPSPAPRLTATELKKISDWINAGALNN